MISDSVQRITLGAGLTAETFGLCDIGCVRQNNEDRLGIFALSGGGALMMVADGMGGHAAGEVAAQITLDTVAELAAARMTIAVPAALGQALELANQRICRESDSNPAQRGMGTTATVLAMIDQRAWFAHIGDSRLYRLRDCRLQQLSEDHSLVAEMVRGGLLSPQDAVDHPCRNVIVRALGIEADMHPQLCELALDVLAEDVFLLCSDGLHDQLTPGELADLLEAPPHIACQALVNLARERGGADNISAVVCRVKAESV